MKKIIPLAILAATLMSCNKLDRKPEYKDFTDNEAIVRDSRRYLNLETFDFNRDEVVDGLILTSVDHKKSLLWYDSSYKDTLNSIIKIHNDAVPLSQELIDLLSEHKKQENLIQFKLAELEYSLSKVKEEKRDSLVELYSEPTDSAIIKHREKYELLHGTYVEKERQPILASKLIECTDYYDKGVKSEKFRLGVFTSPKGEVFLKVPNMTLVKNMYDLDYAVLEKPEKIDNLDEQISGILTKIKPYKKFGDNK